MTVLRLGIAAFERQAYDEAFRLLHPIALEGNAEAQCILGNLYHLGLGMAPNLDAAVQWYEKAAAQGYGVASNNLAGIALTGNAGTPPDPEAAKRLFEQARDQGFEHSPLEV